MLARLLSRLTAPLSLFVLVLLTLSPSQASPSARGIPFLSRPDWSPTFVSGAVGGVAINEVMYYPGSGQSEWVELRNGGPGAANLRGYQLSDEDGNVYYIPTSLPDVPAGAFVVVIFDGAGTGANDYSFSDNVATLHSPASLVNIFEDDADQVALYSTGGNLGNAISLPLVQRNAYTWNPPVPGIPADPAASPLLSYVAWGAPAGEDGAEAERAGLWNRDWYVSPYTGLGDESEEVELGPNESLGLLPNSTSGYPEDWTLFHVGYVTPGTANALPPIDWYYPPANATVDRATFSIIWAPIELATGYHFQLDDSSTFDSPHADTVLTTAFYRPSEGVPEGTYYWRVKVLFSQGESPWSSPLAVNSMALPDPTTRDANGLPVVTSKVLGITWQLQHKDTNMLCLQGDPPTGAAAWNAPHAARGTHGQMYCVRASISMMASYYGGRLSQDRITYEIFKAQKVEAHLGHDIGVAAPPDPTQSNTLSWALGTAVPVQAGKPTFAQFKTWIDAGSPVMSRIPGHMRVIDGYSEFTTLGVTFEFLHLLDPWDGAKWVGYDSDPIAHVYVGPAGTTGAPSVRSDEDADGDGTPDTMDDSDGDGVTDFDELHRFNLNPSNPDSDSDFVRDAQDI
ncbi:MAG TPA: lamin tail domain-containing protein, partial [Ardenticatenaceae bacterium]